MTEPEIRAIRGQGEFEAALRVRRAVFVGEQNGPPEDEPDRWDEAARHFVVLDAGRVVGTARLYQPQPGVGKIGRVALLPEYRGRGWGERLVRALVTHVRACGYREAVLDAQTHACSFYARFGFRVEGEEWVEAGIPHRRMRLLLQPVAADTDGEK